MQVCRELDYGVRAVLVLSLHEGEIISKRRIAEEIDIPINFLAIILPKLVHNGLVESIPGPKGGYKLAKKSGEISMMDVVGSIEKSFAFNRCLDESKGCSYGLTCPVKPHWKKVQNDVESYLSDVTFESLARDYNKS
ncbi:MAG: Rrf2 family transcriptional regulator [Deltaproteobacteria bacterium]|jgi:Rrf2 family protein|nr:Rrf2 family transcriptional regulator [Deltaproteobacteria bacterium]